MGQEVNETESVKVHGLSAIKDSNQVANRKRYLQTDAEKSVDGLVLTDLDKKDLGNRANGVIQKQQSHGLSTRNHDFVSIDKNSVLDKNRKKWSKTKNSESNKIFDSVSDQMNQGRKELKEDLVAIDAIEKEKKSLYDSIQNTVLANQYHKYLNGEYTFEEFEEKTKIANQKGKNERETLLKKLKKWEKKQQRLTKRVDHNKYFKQLVKGTSLPDSLKETDPSSYYQNIDQLMKENSYQNELDSLLSELPKAKQQWDSLRQLREEVLSKDDVETLLNNEQHYIKNTEWSDYSEKEGVVKHTLSDKANFWNKISLEGVVASSGADFKAFSISPNLSRSVGKNASVGIGGTFHYSRETNANIQAALDFKLIGQYDLLRETAFLRVEYIEMIPGISFLEVENGTTEMTFRHTLLLGAGWNINIKGKQFLSFGLMYNANTAMGVPTYDAPMLSRLGIRIF